MRIFRRRPEPSPILVFAASGLSAASLLASPGHCLEQNQSPRLDIAQRLAQKATPKAARSAGAPSTAKKTPSLPEACDPGTRKLDEASAALNRDPPQTQKSCAMTSSPAQFRITGAADRAILVRPLTGDVDVVLKRGGEIIDFSMNMKHRAELVVVPQLGEFEVVVSAASANATFEISTVPIARPNQGKTQNAVVTSQPKNVPPQAPPEQATGDTQTISWIPGALRDVGYDLIDPASATDDAPNPVNLRVVMAFQAGERFPVTGTLSPEQVGRLAELEASQVDALALESINTSRAISGSSPAIKFPLPPDDPGTSTNSSANQDQPPPTGLASMQGAYYNGKFYGLGMLRSGSKFEGEWVDGPTAGGSQRPALGVLTLANDCRANIKTFGTDSGDQLDEAAILSHSIGVVRQKNKKIASGDLTNLTDEQRSACLPAPPQE
jgi:hypothetical protein